MTISGFIFCVAGTNSQAFPFPQCAPGLEQNQATLSVTNMGSANAYVRLGINLAAQADSTATAVAAGATVLISPIAGYSCFAAVSAGPDPAPLAIGIGA
jgi:hypothetical protein